MIRRLLDPTAGEGGGAAPPATPATPAAPAQAAAPAPGQATPPTPPQPPTAITLTPDQHRALLDAAAERDRYRQADAEREAQKKQADEEHLRKKGDYDKLIAARDQELAAERKAKADLESRTRRFVRDRELAMALAGQPIVEGWQDKLMQLWGDKFDVAPDGDSYTVKTLDGKTPAEFVKAQLALPEYSPLVKAGSQGGAPHRGDTSGRAPAAPEGLDPTKPGHAAYARWLDGTRARAEAGFAAQGLQAVPK